MVDLPGGTVTLLFTDIEGSTRLLQRLGDAYAGVLAEHQRLLREAFAAHGGREVDTQGDAFFVAFPRAADAVLAAVAAQRTLAEYPWPDGAAVRVRMGLHTSEPLATGGRYVGLAVHRAARVGSAGHGGQVLLSAATQAILRDQLPPEIGLRDLGEHHLKDFDQPEHLYQLLADGLPTDFPPLKVAEPAPLPPLPVPLLAEDTPLVGREREWALLRERLDATLAGHGGLVLIGGEAGVGKTALAEALAREALDRGARVAIGRCYDLTETPPYGPWREALAAIPAAPDLPPLPAALGGTERGEAVASQAALFARAHTYLTAAASQRPLLLLLDDLHWADPASLDLLRALARQLPTLPLLLLVTYRADELTRRHPLSQLLPLLVREARAAMLGLRALPEEAVLGLVRGRYALPEADERRLAAYLRERAEGHPLFVGELLRTLEEEGTLQVAGRVWSLGDLGGVRVPRLLRQVIEGRLDRLGEADQRLLAVASAIGQEVPLPLWASVADAGEDALLDLVERAAAARLVEPTGGGLRFAHALIREALYEGALPLRRRGWHRRAGEATASQPRADPDAVASHFQRAGDPRAVEWLTRAGERAQQAYAYRTAAERFEAALALLDHLGADASERGWLFFRLARLRRYTDPAKGIAYLDEAERLATAAGDAALRACALFNRGQCRWLIGHFRRGLEEMDEGVAALDALTPAERERLRGLSGVMGSAYDEHARRGTLALWLAFVGRLAEAEALAGRYATGETAPGAGGGERVSYVDAHMALGLVHASLGRPEVARRALARGHEACLAFGHRYYAARVLQADLELVALPYRADRRAERERLAAEAERLWAQAEGIAASHTRGDTRLGLLLVEGRWAEARPLLELRRRAGLLYERAQAAAWLGPLARAQGDVSLAQELVREWLPEGSAAEPGDGLITCTLVLQQLAAALALDAGDRPTARAWLAAHDRWLAWTGAVRGRAEGHLGWAAYHRAAGDAALAQDHAERALALAAEPRQPLALLAAHRLLGELDTEAERYAEAEVHLDAALALAEACAVPYERALTLLAWAELRAATGDREEARARLDEARAILTSLDARPALARADALAAPLAAPPQPREAYPAGLTAREVAVLRLVAEGLTDPEVANRLSLSPRTVDRHLNDVYTKLGVSSRSAATRFAVEHRLA